MLSRPQRRWLAGSTRPRWRPSYGPTFWASSGTLTVLFPKVAFSLPLCLPAGNPNPLLLISKVHDAPWASDTVSPETGLFAPILQLPVVPGWTENTSLG